MTTPETALVPTTVEEVGPPSAKASGSFSVTGEDGKTIQLRGTRISMVCKLQVRGVFYESTEAMRASGISLPPFQSISLDCPWHEPGGGKIKRGTDKHFPNVKPKDMPGVIRAQPLWLPDPAGCAIWMWTTLTSLGVAFDVFKALNIRYVTHQIWRKLGAAGTGRRVRGGHEVLLFGVFGKSVPVPPPKRRLSSWFEAYRPVNPATRKAIHSAKPQIAYDRMMTHDPEGIARADIFARYTRVGWDTCGIELGDEPAFLERGYVEAKMDLLEKTRDDPSIEDAEFEELGEPEIESFDPDPVSEDHD